MYSLHGTGCRQSWSCCGRSTLFVFSCGRLSWFKMIKPCSWLSCAAFQRTLKQYLVSYRMSPTEHFLVPVCPWTQENRLMIVLWCALGLPVGGAIQMTLLLLFTVTVTCIVCNWLYTLKVFKKNSIWICYASVIGLLINQSLNLTLK